MAKPTLAGVRPGPRKKLTSPHGNSHRDRWFEKTATEFTESLEEEEENRLFLRKCVQKQAPPRGEGVCATT